MFFTNVPSEAWNTKTRKERKEMKKRNGSLTLSIFLFEICGKALKFFVQGESKRMAPLVLGLVTTVLLWLLQFDEMSCLLQNYLSKEVQCISIDQLELKLHIKMCFQSDPNFYVFDQIQGVENLYFKWTNFWLEGFTALE